MSNHVKSLLLLLAIFLLGLPSRAFADAFQQGVVAYKGHYYDHAAQYFQTELKQSPGNSEAVFYLGMAYTHLNQYDNARQAFDLLLQMVPPQHELAVKARNNINFLTRQQIALSSNSAKAAQIMKVSLAGGSQDNYLTYVIPGGKVIHFARTRMPLKVYISDGLSVPGWHTGMKQSVTYAMATWQSATQDQVRFAQTYTEANADIIVKWRKNFTDGILGVSPLETIGNTIIRSDLNLAVDYPDSTTPLSMDDLKTVAVHEMGHAIGIRGHSPYPDDLMFFSKNPEVSTLSARDRHTVSMLYKLNADVQNNPNLSTARTRQYYDLYQMGLKAQTGNRPSAAIAYYRQALQLNGTMPEAKFNLGALLINEGNKMVRLNDLSGARRNFEEATHLYGEILQQSSPPEGSEDNLKIARANLSLILNALHQP